MTNTHYGVIAFTGDFDGDHPDEELRGMGPTLKLVACGPEAYCWEALAKWTDKHPLRRGEDVEVVERHITAVDNEQMRAVAYRRELDR